MEAGVSDQLARLAGSDWVTDTDKVMGKDGNSEVEGVEMSDGRWKEIALWLADCTAATAYDYTTKSASKCRRRRHLSICEGLLEMIKAEQLIGRTPSKPEWVIQRLESAIKDLKGT